MSIYQSFSWFRLSEYPTNKSTYCVGCFFPAARIAFPTRSALKPGKSIIDPHSSFTNGTIVFDSHDFSLYCKLIFIRYETVNRFIFLFSLGLSSQCPLQRIQARDWCCLLSNDWITKKLTIVFFDFPSKRLK